MSESRAFNMDCMVAMKEFPDKYFDLAVVDPPYGIGITGTPGGATKPSSRSEESSRNPRMAVCSQIVQVEREREREREQTARIGGAKPFGKNRGGENYRAQKLPLV